MITVFISCRWFSVALHKAEDESNANLVKSQRSKPHVTLMTERQGAEQRYVIFCVLSFSSLPSFLSSAGKVLVEGKMVEQAHLPFSFNVQVKDCLVTAPFFILAFSLFIFLLSISFFCLYSFIHFEIDCLSCSIFESGYRLQFRHHGVALACASERRVRQRRSCSER